jgi:PAS domain S-box-containing protein
MTSSTTFLKVLVFEDQPGGLKAIFDELNKSGYAANPIYVYSEAELSTVLDPDIDIIFADTRQPDAQSLQSLLILKRLGLPIPLIVVIADNSQEYLALEYVRQGAADYVVLDQPARLGLAVKNAIEKRRLYAELRWTEELPNYQRALMESVADAVIFTDLKFTVIAWNSASEKLYGWTTAEAIGHPVSRILSTSYSGMSPEQVYRQVKESGFWQGMVIHKRKDGQPLNISSSLSLIRNSYGLSIGAVIIDREIQEWTTYNQKLRESNRLLEKIFASLQEVVISQDPATRLVLECSPACEQVLGYTRKEMIGRTTEIIFENSEEHEQFGRLMQAGLDRDGTFRIEQRLRRKDGALIYADFTITEIQDEAGRRTGVVVSIHDISRRRQAEESIQRLNLDLEKRNAALRESEARERAKASELQAVMDAVPAVVLVSRDRECREMIGNQYGYAMLGAQAGINLSMNAPDMDPPKNYQVYKDGRALQANEMPMQIAASTGIPQLASEYEVVSENGSTFHLFGNAQPLLDKNGQPVGVVGVFLDITARKEAERTVQSQLKRMSALRTIDSAISMKMPLAKGMDVILDQVIEHLEVNAADILLFNAEKNRLEFGRGKGFQTRIIEETSIPIGEGVAGLVAAQKAPLKVAGLAKDPRFSRSALLKAENFFAYHGAPLIVNEELLGVLEVFHRDKLEDEKEWVDYFETLAGQAAIAIDDARMFTGLRKLNRVLSKANEETIEGWSRAMDLRDHETEGHSQRVTEISIRLAKKMGLSKDAIIHIRRGALLHDIGKVGVPDNILLKNEVLTSEEWVIMKRHPQYAFDLLSPITFLHPALEIPYCHHEKWDGTGYPRGLKGESIPIAARIFAVVDVWDALRSDRSYRKGWEEARVLEYLKEQSGKHFDPNIVKVFSSMLG